MRIVPGNSEVLQELSEAFAQADGLEGAPDEDGSDAPSRNPSADAWSVAESDTPSRNRSTDDLDAALDELGVEVDARAPRSAHSTSENAEPDDGESEGGESGLGSTSAVVESDTAESDAEADDDTQPTERDQPRPAVTTIAIGGDDGLPDVAYLDDELDRQLDTESVSAPVFIDDDGSSDAIAAKDATGPGIEPRLRQRRIGVRRAESRRRLIWAAIGAGVFIVVVAVLAVLGSGLFSVDEVDVTGVRRADDEAVAAVVDDLLGEPVLLVDTGQAEDRLEAIPYVATARVRTDFPDAATIEVRERKPVATARGTDGRFRILDREGRVVDVIDGQPIEFVLIAGEEAVDLDAGEFANTGHAAASAMVTKLTPEVRARLISMAVTADGSDLRFTLSNEPGENIEARLGAAVSDSDQIERLVRLQRRLDDVVGSDTTMIDVSTDETTER